MKAQHRKIDPNNLTINFFLKNQDKHAKDSKNIIKDNFGDSYLYAHNLIFSNIRDATLNAGYRFTSRPFSGSNSLPLSSLQEYHKRKKIPYLDNVSRLRILSRKYGHVLLPFESPILECNFILHESAHAVAHAQIKNLIKNHREKEKERFFFFALEESYANTIEFFADRLCYDHLSAIYLTHNSYFGADWRKRPHPKRNSNPIFLRAEFICTWISFLFSNYLYQRLDPNDIRDAFSLLKVGFFDLFSEGFSSKQRQDLTSRLNDGFLLSANFRTNTTQFFLSLNGFKKDVFALAKMDFLNFMGRNLQVTEAMNSLTNIALTEKEGELSLSSCNEKLAS